MIPASALPSAQLPRPLVLPADAAGFVRAWVARRCAQLADEPENVAVDWQPAGDCWADLPDVVSLVGLALTEKTRLLRLLDLLHNPWPLRGSWCARGIGAAGALGMLPLTNSLLNAWMNERWPPRLEGRAGALTRMVERKFRSALVRERLSPEGRLWLGDLPAGLTPLATRRWLCLWSREPLEVLSGGDRLAPGTWLWQFSAEGNGRVIERRPPDAAGI